MEDYVDINKYLDQEKFSEQDEIGEYSEKYEIIVNGDSRREIVINNNE